jgi:hypothetical protein
MASRHGLRKALGEGSFRDADPAADTHARELAGTNQAIDRLPAHVEEGRRLSRGEKSVRVAHCHASGSVVETARTALEIRHAAAIKLVEAGDLDGVLALSLVVWPRRGSRLEDEHVPQGTQF